MLDIVPDKSRDNADGYMPQRFIISSLIFMLDRPSYVFFCHPFFSVNKFIIK